jgi:asparaginyl-tRNA synthetase
MDILFLIEKLGGSQREERFDVLVEKMKALGIDEEELWWYFTRRFGSAVHSGLDLDLKDWSCNWNDEHTRRDSFPRTPLNAEF